MFFTSTGLVYHVCIDYTKFECTSHHVQGKMFLFEGSMKHTGRQINISIISSDVLSLWKQTVNIWHFFSLFGSPKLVEEWGWQMLPQENYHWGVNYENFAENTGG